MSHFGGREGSMVGAMSLDGEREQLTKSVVCPDA